MLVHAEGTLGLVEDGLAGRAVDLTVLAAAGLVSDLLAERLVVVGLGATGRLLAVPKSICKRGVHTERTCRQCR